MNSVACLWTELFKLPCRVTFGGLLAEDEPKTETGFCSSSDALVIQKICGAVSEIL